MITVRSAYATSQETVASGTAASAPAAAVSIESAPRTNHPMMSSPGTAASNGSAENNADVMPYTASHVTARGGRSAGPSSRARPTLAAGEDRSEEHTSELQS